MSRIKLLLDVIEDMRSLADSLQALAQAAQKNDPPETPPAPKTEEAPPNRKLTTVEMRDILRPLCQEGFTDRIHDIIRKYGAENLGKVDPVHYEAILKEVEALKDGGE